jgi:hypothetical protein
MSEQSFKSILDLVERKTERQPDEAHQREEPVANLLSALTALPQVIRGPDLRRHWLVL